MGIGIEMGMDGDRYRQGPLRIATGHLEKCKFKKCKKNAKNAKNAKKREKMQPWLLACVSPVM